MSIYCSPLTNDSLFTGRLVCRQYRQGYRFSIDAVLAAHFCTVHPGDNVLDLGCGCGVIGLVIAFRNRGRGVHVTGFEFQSDLAMLAHDNILANELESDVSVVEGDLRRIKKILAPESVDLVVCNPPYRMPDSGRVSLTDQKARARHEIDATLDDVVDAASFAVKNRGQAVFVYPAKRAATLINTLRNKNLEPKRLQPVYSYPGCDTAALVLVEAVKNGGEELQFMDPLYIYTEKNGPYTDVVQQMYDA